MATVRDPSPRVLELSEDWDLICDLMGGTRAMRLHALCDCFDTRYAIPGLPPQQALNSPRSAACMRS